MSESGEQERRTLGDYAAVLAAHDEQSWQQEPGVDTDDHTLVHIIKTLFPLAVQV